MKKVLRAAVAASVLTWPAAASAADRFDVYVGDVPRERLADLVELGVDRHEIELKAASGRGKDAAVRVEVIISGGQAAELRREGVELEPKEVGGQTVAQRATALAADGFEVFRTYAGEDGLKAEFEQMAREHRRIAELQTYGRTTNGQEIVALKVTRHARWHRDGRKPAVLYLGAQHAREWITPEMIRRLAHHILDNYDTSREIRELVDENELWFVPVANPDGYDFSFEPGQRLWRKNLRDNNGDGTIAPGDGVDLNRNFAYKWGYDNEGSSPDEAEETYRGPGPNSEPETQALDRFVRRVGFEFFVNYHSAAELLLYGTGWQVSTPTPDDVIAEALAGDDAEPAVPGYDPDISAELYTTNGDTDTHMTESYGTFGFTPEMSTCEAASDSVPDDEWEAEDCGSGFEFPDAEQLVLAEFEKNIPFALSIAESAADYLIGSNPPFSPVEGERYAGALHGDDSYTRLTRTIDLTGATSAELAFQLSLNIEPGYDHVIVEARTAGGDDWTTLPDLEGGTVTDVPQECVGGGFLLTLHPHLRHYLGGTGAEPCTPTGSSGTWNAFNEATAGWEQARFDLSGFAGSQVEVSIAYVTDPAGGGVGAFVDDTRLTVDGTTTADGFEGETSSWAVTGPPKGSPPDSMAWET